MEKLTFTLSRNTATGTVELKFSAVPPEEVLGMIASNRGSGSFRWHSQKKVWYAKEDRIVGMEIENLRKVLGMDTVREVGRTLSFPEVLDAAYAAGVKAGDACVPKPMLVADTMGPERWVVPSGVCGFAYIKLTPATQFFAKWFRTQWEAKLEQKYPAISFGLTASYSGGYDINVRAFNQSMEKKMAFASAFAAVLAEHGVKCHAFDRID